MINRLSSWSHTINSFIEIQVMSCWLSSEMRLQKTRRRRVHIAAHLCVKGATLMYAKYFSDSWSAHAKTFQYKHAQERSHGHTQELHWKRSVSAHRRRPHKIKLCVFRHFRLISRTYNSLKRRVQKSYSISCIKKHTMSVFSNSRKGWSGSRLFILSSLWMHLRRHCSVTVCLSWYQFTA